MVIPPGDYQGPLCSGVTLPSSLRVLTLTPGRTWALSSPYLRPGSSHQVPSLSETPVSGSQTGLVCSSHHKGSRANYRGGDLWGPSVLTQGPLSPPSGTSPCLQSGPGILASPQLQPRPLTPGGPVSPRPGCQEVRPCLFRSFRPTDTPD